MINTKQAIIQALADLGDTEDKVYRSLKDLGIQGERYRGHRCPIANYLRSKLDKEIAITVSNSEVCVELERVKTPPAVSDFIIDFDNSTRYSDLSG
jgi:hypothetical protein